MQGTQRIIKEDEWNRLLSGSDEDFAFTQSFAFGQAASAAYAEYSFEPRLFEFAGGAQFLLPLMRIKTRLPGINRFEAAPFGLRGLPISLSGVACEPYLPEMVRLVRADSIVINGGAVREALQVEAAQVPSEENTPISRPGSGLQLRTTPSVTHVLDLSGGFETVWTQHFSTKVRNQCRTAERKGLEIMPATTTADFDAYYALYEESSRRWGYAAPPYPRALFHALGQLTGRGVEMLLGRYEGQAVAGVLMLHGRHTTNYWGAVMDKEFAFLCPNNGLLKHAIEQACARGVEAFDFGVSGQLDSVRKYKESFGARPFAYENYSYSTARYDLMTRARQAVADKLAARRAKPGETETVAESANAHGENAKHEGAKNDGAEREVSVTS